MQIFKKWEMVKFLDAIRLSNSVADLKLMIWFLMRIWEYLSLSQDCSVSMILKMEIQRGSRSDDIT